MLPADLIGQEVRYTGNMANEPWDGVVREVKGYQLGIETADGWHWLPFAMLVACTERNARHANCLFLVSEYRAVRAGGAT
jgi:hypothetical protein